MKAIANQGRDDPQSVDAVAIENEGPPPRLHKDEQLEQAITTSMLRLASLLTTLVGRLK